MLASIINGFSLFFTTDSITLVKRELLAISLLFSEVIGQDLYNLTNVCLCNTKYSISFQDRCSLMLLKDHWDIGHSHLSLNLDNGVVSLLYQG